jgi:signal transduction histidine kinase
LAGGVGHELRNPLGIINNAIYLLRLIQPSADEKVKEYLGIIQAETRNADKIITDLLDFSRINSVDREPVRVPELVRTTLERFPVSEGVTVTLIFPDDLAIVYVDPHQMTQVLGNLVINACQAMASTSSAGTQEGSILSLSAAQEGEEIAIAVKDTGVGISPENLDKIFEPLFTTKPKGIGLGLAVSRKLVEANSGRIEVRSEQGKGSTFTVYLPVGKANQ